MRISYFIKYEGPRYLPKFPPQIIGVNLVSISNPHKSMTINRGWFGVDFITSNQMLGLPERPTLR